MSYYTLIHDGGGSAVEAATALYIFGPFEDEDPEAAFAAALAAGEDYYEQASKISDYFEEERFYSVIDTTSATTVANAIKKDLS